MREDKNQPRNHSAPPLPSDVLSETLSSEDTSAIDALISQRPQILRIKLAVLATQISERLQIRANNLENIHEELLAASNALSRFEDLLPSYRLFDDATQRLWIERQSKLAEQVRTQDVECWRDVAQSMNDFLTVWEAVEQSKVRGDFLREQRNEDAQ